MPEDGLIHRNGLNNLRELDLGFAGVTDDGLVDLRRLEDMDTLHIVGTKITSADLQDTIRDWR
jgi:hypothetical protein